jgi:hypothetical protein
MPETTLTDTKDKMIMKDHDLLIQLTTQMADLIRRFEESNKIMMQYAADMKAVSVEQVRVDGRLKALEDDFTEYKEATIRWQSKWESKSNVWDVLNSLGLLVSAAVGYFFGGR